LSEPARDKSRHVPVDVSEARIARLWDGVSVRLDRPHRGHARWFAVAAACAALALVGGVRLYSAEKAPEVSVWEGARLETARDRMSVSLVDGSKLTLDPNSRVTVQDRTASAVKLVLEHGRLACDVTHVPGRSFVVVAHGVEVRVVGTLFSVTSERADNAVRVEVRVERGAVEVRGPGEHGELTRVEAGRSWSQLTRTAASAPSSAAPSASQVEPAAAPSAEPAPQAEPAAPPSAEPSGTQPSSGARAQAPSGVASDARPASARELFEQASGLWREGRPAEAAQAYQTFLSTYPRDGRAGLAAFELGRLRMDRLGDPAGALKALERAMALAPGSGFREDALARIVNASSSLGQLSRCNGAREQYLREYPNGVHRLRVSKACGAH